MTLLSDVVVILGSAFVSSLLAQRLRIPNIIGFIIAGALIGPYAFHLIEAGEEVHFFAELGVILLLFAIGLEFSPAHLARLRRIALLGGSLQILLTMLLVSLAAYGVFKLSFPVSIFVGAYVALSSTAIVLTLLQERGELETPHGRASLGILLFQDLAVVPLILLVPLLAGELRLDEGLWLVGAKSGLIFSLLRFLLGYPVHVAFLVGVSLFQVGEFSFVLAKEALARQLITASHFQLLSSVSIFTMLLTPLVIELARQKLPRKVDEKACPLVPENHFIIVGLGVTGQALRTAAKKVGIPYVIIEMNPETVRREKAKGEPIVFGDATFDYILRQAGLEKARALAITIPDSKAARAIVNVAKGIKPDLYILARTKFVAEMPLLLKLGADEVVPDELVTALSMFARMLRLYMVPEEEIQRYLEEFTRRHYQLFVPPE